jgi:hypothetical protein
VLQGTGWMKGDTPARMRCLDVFPAKYLTGVPLERADFSSPGSIAGVIRQQMGIIPDHDTTA